MKYQVVWLIGTMTGRGKPFDEPSIAQAWADAQNKIYGRGTHWVVEIVPNEERRP